MDFFKLIVTRDILNSSLDNYYSSIDESQFFILYILFSFFIGWISFFDAL